MFKLADFPRRLRPGHIPFWRLATCTHAPGQLYSIRWHTDGLGMRLCRRCGRMLMIGTDEDLADDPRWRNVDQLDAPKHRTVHQPAKF